MRIGHYVSVVAGQKGFENNVSGHIQVPLHAMKLLKEAGHEVHLITNRFGPDRSMPACLPGEVPVHLVDDGRRRGGVLERKGAPSQGVSPLGAWRQARQILTLTKQHRFDVLHVYGVNRTAMLAGALRMLGMPCPAVATLVASRFPKGVPEPVSRLLWSRVDAVLTATEFTRGELASRGIESKIVRHGIVRDLGAELGGQTPGPRTRVLFWRDPSHGNGADVVKAVYERLAPRYPNITFEMAVRPHWDEVPGLDELPGRFDNVRIHRFPYPEGFSLARLIHESVAILMPIRVMSIEPQLVIAESMAVGAPVIATNKRSMPELIHDGDNGLLIPLGDADAAAAALQRLLDNPQAAAAMSRRAAETIREEWNWDRYVDDVVGVYESLGAPARGAAEVAGG